MISTKKSNRVYPGLVCSGIEFFSYNDQLKVIQNQKIKDFNELPYPVVNLLEEEIKNNKELQKALKEWHPNSNYKRLEQFTRCRFGGLDFTPDICNNKLQKGEFWDCPNRSNCKYNGIICKLPVYNDIEISITEIALMKLLSSNATNEVIALELNKPLGTVHKLKQHLYSKLKIQTKQELAIIAVTLNII